MLDNISTSLKVGLGLAVATTVVSGGAIYKKYATRNETSMQDLERLAAIEQAKTDQKIKEVLGKNLITEYYLPKAFNEKIVKVASDQPQPIFNEDTKKQIGIIKAMIKKSLGEQGPLQNLIFTGSAGVGKTMLAEKICRETGIGFIRIPSGAMEKHIRNGTHIVAFREILNVAEKSLAPTYLIMDDGEELVAQRPQETKHVEESTTKAAWIVEHERLSETIGQRRVALVNAILEESGKEYRKSALCITTNRLQIIDGAFLTRSRVIPIQSPTTEERKQIIITHLPTVFRNDMNMLSFFHKGRLEDMAMKTEGFTGRNIVNMLEEIYACVQLEAGDINQDTVDASILAMRASVERENGRENTSQSLISKIYNLFFSFLK